MNTLKENKIYITDMAKVISKGLLIMHDRFPNIPFYTVELHTIYGESFQITVDLENIKDIITLPAEIQIQLEYHMRDSIGVIH